MSGFSKNQHYVYDVQSTRSNQAANYSGIIQPAFDPQYTAASAGLTHEPLSANMPYLPSSTYESRGAANHRSDAAFIDAEARHPAPLAFTETEITEQITPAQGTAGSTVTLQLRTNYDLEAHHCTFTLMFGDEKCVGALQKVEYDDHDQWYNYVLNVEVPPFPLTNTWDPTMMLKLQIEDKMGRSRIETNAGKFTYTDMSPNLAYQSSSDFSKKRKYSTEVSDTQSYPEANINRKRAKFSRYAQPSATHGAYSGVQGSPLQNHPPLSSPYRQANGYEASKQTAYAPEFSQKGLYAMPSGMGVGHGNYKPSHLSPNLHSYGTYSSPVHGAHASVPTTVPVLPSPAAVPAPVLVRATHLAQASGSSSSTQPFNPYSMYQSKAILKIEGDLDKMSDDWTTEELHAKRRLVEFKRSQHGSTITTSFAPVTPEARPARSICVSCIWWEEKDEHFITSVDTIYLLEQLVNVRFTVEEKNRIRRNLEGFRPLTVSKAKQDSEDFFKVIMGFPNPKPRNIEKDVKVFPWKILSHALKKIISKYSASYSSTAGVGSLPLASTAAYTPSAVSQAVMDTHRNTSPQSVSASIASTVYTPHMASSSLSPNQKMAAGLEGSAGHSMPVAQQTPPGQSMTQWGASTHQVSPYPATLTPGTRGSWDYGYLNASGVAEMPSMAHPLQMPRPNQAAELSHMPANSAYHPYSEGTTRV
ncbi:hypothetical protein yc1106_02870 [Curvularia clavata]|uniref:DUF7082 domain-containing protein n=1 Tax=Curvularia clavata TaxID=95742 RepID=A0A9Q8Z3K3_CURCL|nr:hypothetical protein yc1106_02870 [Curvularia clavata]